MPGLGDVALPSAPYYRVPEPQQERVALLPRSEVRARPVEKAGRDLVATVHHVVEEHALGVVDILRTQDHEVGAVVDHAARIERREREIDDAGIRGIRRIELAVNDAGDHLVRTDITEGRAAVRIVGCGDLEPVDITGLPGGCSDGNRSDKRGEHEPSIDG